jgi:opacity protein-like surface antigen
MKRVLLACALILAVAVQAKPASAGKGAWEVGLVGGIGSPTGSFKDSLEAKSGPQGGLEICYHITDVIAVGVDGSWNRNKHKGEGDVEDLGGGTTLTADKDRYTITQFGIHGRYMVPTSGPLDPYGLVGVGIYNLKEDYEYTYFDGSMETVFTDESDMVEQPGSKFGFRLGAGASYMVSPKIAVGVAADYNHVSIDKDKFGISTVPWLSFRGRITYHIMPK